MGKRRDPGERYRRADAAEIEQEVVANEGVLARVPEWVVPLGAGFLFTATLITATLFVLSTYLLVTGDYTGLFAPFEEFRARMFLVVLQTFFATAFMGVGTRFARQRTHWGTVLLAGIFGSLIFITIPFTLPSMVLIALGKYHFALTTPVDRIQGSGAG